MLEIDYRSALEVGVVLLVSSYVEASDHIFHTQHQYHVHGTHCHWRRKEMSEL